MLACDIYQGGDNFQLRLKLTKMLDAYLKIRQHIRLRNMMQGIDEHSAKTIAKDRTLGFWEILHHINGDVQHLLNIEINLSLACEFGCCHGFIFKWTVLDFKVEDEKQLTTNYRKNAETGRT